MRGENVGKEGYVMTDKTGKIETTYSDQYLTGVVAKAMRESGRTCDSDDWDTVMAWEAIRALRQLGALK